MWTAHRDDGAVGENWIPNHFAPPVIRTQRLLTVKLQSFYQVLWGGETYIGEVLQKDKLLEPVCISFLVAGRRDGTCTFSQPEILDVSWEPISSFEHEVKLFLTECFSSQRTQYSRVLHHASRTAVGAVTVVDFKCS